MSRRLTAQQEAVLEALVAQSPLPTTILRDVAIRCLSATGAMTSVRIGEPVADVLRRLQALGLVSSQLGSDCNDWSVTDEGADALQALQDARPSLPPTGASPGRIGYIVVLEADQEGNWPHPSDGSPLRVYLDREEAEREARTLDGVGTDGGVWELQLP